VASLTIDHLTNGYVAACTLLLGSVYPIAISEAGPAVPASPAPAENPDEAAELLQDFLFALTRLPDELFFKLGTSLPRSLVLRTVNWMSQQPAP
jgi:hypothetical protein